jgi:Zn-dependent peptidase ImmA (M78 family)
MPREELLLLVTFGFMPVIPAMFGGYYSPADFEFIKKLADWYNVSQVAMAIRLKELGLIEINGDLEYASAESLAG